MGMKQARRPHAVLHCAGSARGAACASLIRHEGMDFNDMLLGSALQNKGGSIVDKLDYCFEADEVAAAIDGAEEIRDPLEGLVERAATDPGAAFAPDVLERLAALKKSDLAAFETLRAQLKEAGCRVTALDEALAEENGDTGGRDPKQADILVSLAADADLFHAADGTSYADLEINGHRESWPIRSKGFKRWLARQFFEATAAPRIRTRCNQRST